MYKVIYEIKGIKFEILAVNTDELEEILGSIYWNGNNLIDIIKLDSE